MNERPRIRTTHAELSLEEVAEALPGTGEVMAAVGRCYAACWHAAHGGNWELAAYYLRRVRGLQRKLAVVRPKYRDQLDEFEREALLPLAAALDRHDLAAFETAYDFGVERANHYHVATGKSYIRWKLPSRPPEDLDLAPG